MKNFKLLTLLFAIALSFSACKDDEEESNIVNFNATLTGAQEVPAVNTSATGTLVASYDKTTNKLTYALAFSGLTASAQHFHKGAAGVAGPVAAAIASTALSSTIDLTAEQETDLLAGNWYVNVHTTANAGGEIRAQLIPQ